MRHLVTFVFAAAVLLAAGCGKPKPPEPVAIAGTVRTAAGKAVPRAVLRLHRMVGDSQVDSVTVTPDAAGAFKTRGLAGSYRATIMAIPVADGGGVGTAGTGPLGAPAGVPGQYAKADETPWRFEVGEGGKTDVSLVVP